MKVGIRTPNPKKILKAKTTGRVERAVKSSVNPVYGKAGVGYLRDPERAIKNKIYHAVTFDPLKNVKKEAKKSIRSSEGHLFPVVLFYIFGVIFGIATTYLSLFYEKLNVACLCITIVCFLLFIAFYKRKYG